MPETLFPRLKDLGYAAVVRLLDEGDFASFYCEQTENFSLLCTREDASPFTDTAWPTVLSQKCRSSFLIRAQDADVAHGKIARTEPVSLASCQLHAELLFHFVPLAIVIAARMKMFHESRRARAETIADLESFIALAANLKRCLPTVLPDQAWPDDDEACASLLLTRLQVLALHAALSDLALPDDMLSNIRSHQSLRRSHAREDRTAFAGALGFAWFRCTGKHPTPGGAFGAFVEGIAVALGDGENETWDRPVANAIERWSPRFACVDQDPFLTTDFPGSVRSLMPKTRVAAASPLGVALKQAARDGIESLAAGRSGDHMIAKAMFNRHFLKASD